jgi:hypothetical protein
MPRSFSPGHLVALPRLTAISTARLLQEMLHAAAEESSLPASIATDRDDLAAAHTALTTTLKRRLAAQAGDGPQVRVADQAEDNAFGAFVDWLRSLARLPEDRHPEAKDAKAVLHDVFPSGLVFLNVTSPDKWQEAENRLQLIADKGYDVTLSKLNGVPFLDELQKAHTA